MLNTTFTEMTVLIVEDDEALLEPLKQMVRDFGVHSVLTARSGDESISLLGDVPIDMIISNYALPPSDGIEFARRLRHGEGGADPETPIIMLAGDDERIEAQAARDIGVNGFIDKPVSPTSLYSSMLSETTKPREFINTKRYIGPDRRANPRGYSGNIDADHDERIVVEWAKVKSAMSAPPESKEAPFIRSVHNDIEAIIRTLDEAAHDPSRRRQAMRSIGSLAGFIMEQGRNENYPLMSSIAESLHNTCRGEPQGDPQGAPKANSDQLEAVKSHITAMAALISDKIDGDGRAIGSTILDLLRHSDREQNIHPQPVAWPRGTA